MTLDNVQSTATAHTAGGRDGASHRDDGRLDVELSSPGTPGPGTHPEVNHAPTAKRVLPRRRMIMFAVSSAPTRRSVLATAAAAGALGLVLLAASSSAQTVPALPTKRHAAADADAVRPFRKEATMTTTMTQLNKETTMTTTMTQRDTVPSTATAAVHPFRINVPEAALVDLRRRVAATR